MKIRRTRKPKGDALSVLMTLGDSWYEKGLNTKDVHGITTVPIKNLQKIMDQLIDDGFLQPAAGLPSGARCYLITELGRQVLADETPG